ncbi:MAG: DUF6278 family protein [Actinomycetota bacterium]|nr:DUF6278 family protein [Actinomycetota bacterium]
MHGKWRQWLPGPKHGIARGVVVWGSAGAADPTATFELMGQCRHLRAWAVDRGIDLDDAPDSLPALDRLVATWSGDPAVSSILDLEAGGYLGTVIVRHVPGSAWRSWPNGHPVVHVSSGRDLDVIAQAASHPGSLAAIYTNASI